MPTDSTSPARSSADVRGLLFGSGAGLAAPGMAEEVVELTGRAAATVEVVYLGTATYDRVEPRARQIGRLAELGCTVTTLDVAWQAPPPTVIAERIAQAHVIAVSGGNTLYAVDRWTDLGVDQLLREAIARGAVICGGSAGAICWFDGGHSDSMDPTSYREPVPADDPRASEWRYLRVDGLGVLPGLLCPHYDVTQRNGVLRAADFDLMVGRHPGETGVGLDDAAGLLLEGEGYRVVAAGDGAPAAWVVEAGSGSVRRRRAEPAGDTADLLRPARSIEPDPLVARARAENPGPPS